MTKVTMGFGVALRLGSLLGAALVATACGDDASGAPGACGKDTDCKGDRICVDGACVDPNGGVGGAGGSTSKEDGGVVVRDPNEPIDDPALEMACMRDCTARLSAGCDNTSNLSLDQCNAQCLIIDEQNRGYCLDELRERYTCLANGGYTCVNGFQQPKSTCIEEQQAVSVCAATIPCHDFCDRTGGGCSTNESDCYDDCTAEVDAMRTTTCSGDYGLLLNCWTNQSSEFSCQDGAATVGECGRWVASTADCLGRRGEVCDGFCWAADRLGCGDGCAADCAAKAADTSCGFYWERVISCAVERSALQLECVDGAPVATVDCESDVTQYDDCIGTN